jgi:hypothetical protein
MKMTKRQKTAWKWTKRGAAATAVALVIREAYLGFGPRREHRRAVFEQAQRRAQELGRPLLVLGDPDGGVLNRMLGRQWQCGDVCVDLMGCGICGERVQGRPEDVLQALDDNAYVVYDPGAFAKADDATEMAIQLKRVTGGEVYMADAGPWTLTAFFGPKRKRRIYEPPQLNAAKAVTYKPLLWHPDPRTGREKMDAALAGAPTGYLGNLYSTHTLSGLGYGRRFG